VPFFLVSFYDSETNERVCACPRGLLRTVLARLEEKGYGAMAGGEFLARAALSTCHRSLAEVREN
jgi:glutamine synthetase